MNVYDELGSEYDRYRSEVGVRVVLDVVHEMGGSPHVMDLGCGTGYPIAVRVAPLVSTYLGVDNSEPMLSAFRKNVPEAECRLLDMSDIESIGGAWDLIFSWGSLCHLSIDRQSSILACAAQLLNPDGQLMFTGGEESGQCKGSVGPHVNAIDHYSMGKTGYAELLAANGMKELWAEAREAGNFTYLYKKMPSKPDARDGL